MRAMVFDGVSPQLDLRQVPDPVPKTDKVMIKVEACGVCRTDLLVVDGDLTEQSRRTDNTLVKALGRAFRWKRILETGEFATIAELAERGGIAPYYMTRVLRLTLLAPDLAEAIQDGSRGPISRWRGS